MTPPLPPQRPKAPSRPDLLLDQQPERGAVRHPGVDGVPQAAPKRSATLTGLVAPPAPGSQPPPLPPTKPAPPRHPLKATWRVPTPPSAAALARRSDPPPHGSPPEPDVDQEPVTAVESPQARQASREQQLEAKLLESSRELAELRRQARVQAETASPASHYPLGPPARHQSPVPSSGPAGGIRIEGPGGFKLTVPQAVVLAVLASAGLGGGAIAIAKPSADPSKTDAMLVSQEATRADVALLREQTAGMLKREAARDQYVRCLEESLDEVGEQLLPAVDRLQNASPLRAYTKRCQRLRP